MKKEMETKIIQEYENGTSVLALSKWYDISRSSLYHWIKKYKHLPSRREIKISTNQYYLQEEPIVNCHYASSLKEKLYALEVLYGRYSVHELCNALGVSRATFYNHVKRNKKADIKHAE